MVLRFLEVKINDFYLDRIFACESTLLVLITHDQERPTIFVKGQASHCVVGHDCLWIAKIFADLNCSQFSPGAHTVSAKTVLEQNKPSRRIHGNSRSIKNVENFNDIFQI